MMPLLIIHGFSYLRLVHTAHRVYIHIMVKKPMTFRLNEAARKRLAELASEQGLSATAVIEGLILGFGASTVKTGPIQPTPETFGPPPGEAVAKVREDVVAANVAGKPEQAVGGIKRRRVIPKAEWKK